MKNITLIAIVSNNNVLGNIEKKEEIFNIFFQRNLRKLKKESPYCSLIMGRKTYELVKMPLEKRLDIVLSRNKKNTYNAPITFCNSIEEALRKSRLSSKDIYIIGGGEIFNQTIDLVNKLQLTRINRYVNGNSFFPHIDSNKWEKIHNENHNDYAYLTYTRKEEDADKRTQLSGVVD